METARVDTDANLGSLVDRVVSRLESGHLVALASDGGYCLIADVSYSGGADKLFAVTKRPRKYELSMLVADVDQAMDTAVAVGASASSLLNKFWPGPLTVVLPRDPEFVADLGSDEDTIGLHCPDQLLARLVCDEFGPVATAAACLHSQAPATTAQEVSSLFGDAVSLVVDSGPTVAGRTTVVDCTGAIPKCIREGLLCWTDVQSVLA